MRLISIVSPCYNEEGNVEILTEPATASHDVDVVNHTMAKEEAARLLARLPKVIIYLPETEQQP